MYKIDLSKIADLTLRIGLALQIDILQNDP